MSSSLGAQADKTPAPNFRISPLAHGIEVRAGELHERVTALREDVLRVRVWRGAHAPEDASWAVLPQARRAAVTVIALPDGNGFRTDALLVEVDPSTLEITVRDPDGTILQQDARPVRFDGDAFRIYKAMPRDEHYFGLGDKTGPLDRRNEAFTLWNTDAYRFQESTDPIYKSIPYFMTFRAGRATGLLLDNTWRSSFDFGKESPSRPTRSAPPPDRWTTTCSTGQLPDRWWKRMHGLPDFRRFRRCGRSAFSNRATAT